MNTVNWVQVIIDIFQAVISGIFVGIVIYWLDERRAKRDRRLSDFRIASNWEILWPKVSLRNFDLTGSNLSGYDLAKANLENSIFRKASLWGTNLNDANLRRTDFRSATIVGVSISNAIALYSNFSNVLIRKQVEDGRIWTPDFTNTKFRRVNFRNATIKDAIFHNTNLQGADFSGAIVNDCDFTGADLIDSKWSKVKHVENCIWIDVKINKPETFQPKLWKEIQSQNTMEKV
jgi:uncharacterized protein YjbI with pentapeptide repeats